MNPQGRAVGWGASSLGLDRGSQWSKAQLLGSVCGWLPAGAGKLSLLPFRDNSVGESFAAQISELKRVLKCTLLFFNALQKDCRFAFDRRLVIIT